MGKDYACNFLKYFNVTGIKRIMQSFYKFDYKNPCQVGLTVAGIVQWKFGEIEWTLRNAGILKIFLSILLPKFNVEGIRYNMPKFNVEGIRNKRVYFFMEEICLDMSW